ncbi:hypothetical protein [Candidatus Pyrohabitans sp.]
MRLLEFLKFYLVMLILLFLGMNFFTLSAEQKVLLLLIATLASPTLFRGFLQLRGVRRGDLVLVSYSQNSELGMVFRKELGRALSSGKVGDVIEVELPGRVAKGELKSVGGFVFPPEVSLLYYEEVWTRRREP